MSSEDEMTLRDRFAIEVLKSLLDGKSKIHSLEAIANDKEQFCRTAYQFADMMRQVRLAVFE